MKQYRIQSNGWSNGIGKSQHTNPIQVTHKKKSEDKDKKEQTFTGRTIQR